MKAIFLLLLACFVVPDRACAESEPAKGASQRTDIDSNPLPEHAIARLGTNCSRPACQEAGAWLEALRFAP